MSESPIAVVDAPPAAAPAGPRGGQPRRRLAIAATAVAVVALLAAVVAALLPWASPAGPAEPGRATLPATFAPRSAFTATVSASPGGRAIALYEYGSSELFTTWQTLVAGADRDTYRRVDSGDDPAPAVLLAPDGGSVLFYHAERGTDEFTLQDLATGATRTLHSVPWTSNVGGAVRMLAWSPDGRYVAYAVPAPPPGTGDAADSMVHGQPIEQLAILDVRTDTSVRYPAVQPVFEATFGPTGDLAVQLDRDIWMGTVDGRELRRFPLPGSLELVSGVGWSPDGALLAATSVPDTDAHEETLWLLDATGTGRPTPDRRPGIARVAGWRSATSVVVERWLDDEQVQALVEVSLVDGHTTTLTRFADDRSCEYGMARCEAYRVQLAQALLASASVREVGSPDRGPYVPLSRVAGVLLGALLVWLAVSRVQRWRHRRRARPGPVPAGGAGPGGAAEGG